MAFDHRPFGGRRRAEGLARKLGGAAAIRVDDAPAPGTRDVRGSRYFVLQSGQVATYWPVTAPEDERTFELREDEHGDLYGVQVSGPPEPDVDGADDWDSFEGKLREMLERPHS